MPEWPACASASVTFLAPELQNLSGKNLFCFSLALVGQSPSLFIHFQSLGRTRPCKKKRIWRHFNTFTKNIIIFRDAIGQSKVVDTSLVGAGGCEIASLVLRCRNKTTKPNITWWQPPHLDFGCYRHDWFSRFSFSHCWFGCLLLSRFFISSLPFFCSDVAFQLWSSR
jgi:hypothetical protein